MAVSDGVAVVVYKDLGLVAQVFDEPILGALDRAPRDRPPRYSTTGSCTWENAQPSYRPSRSRRRDRVGPQRKPDQHRRAGGVVRRGRRRAPTVAAASRRGDQRLRPDHRDARRPPRPLARGRGDGGAAAAARRVLAGLHGRAHALRRPRPARRPAAGAGPARARLGRRERERRPGHRRCVVRPRDRARRADRDRRARPALAALRRGDARRAACSSTSTWPVPTPRSPAGRCRRPGSRSAGGWHASTRSTPTW